MNVNVLNFGSLNYDYVYQVDHNIMSGETEFSTSMETCLGGKGFNQSVALAKAGVPVFHGGTLGEEGALFLEACDAYGVNTDYIRSIPGKSGHTIIQVDKNGGNSIILYGGANRRQSREWIDGVLEHFFEGDFIVLQNEINDLDYLIDKAYDRGLRIVLNPSPYDAGLEHCDLTKVSYFLLNEIEGEMMTGFKEPDQILDELKKKYPKAAVVLTLGTAGAWYQDTDGSCIFQEAFKVKAVDTTAAGDTFTGYFIAGLIEERDMKDILKRCAFASSLAVQRAGAAQSIPVAAEITV